MVVRRYRKRSAHNDQNQPAVRGAALTPNAGVEFRLSDRWSLDLSGGYNPWTFNDGKKLKHWLVQPAKPVIG